MGRKGKLSLTVGNELHPLVRSKVQQRNFSRRDKTVSGKFLELIYYPYLE